MCLPQLAAALLLLAAVLVQQPHPAAAADGAALDEGTIMRRLRQAANDAGLVEKQAGTWAGWGPQDTAIHHCSWQGVTCDTSQHVTRIQRKSSLPLRSELPPPSNTTVLLPELAQLPFLTSLEMDIGMALPGMPQEWGQAGAFRRLESLVLNLPAFTAPDPLPAVEPGALPRLMQLDLTLIYQEQPVLLPPSWGHPTAWPSLNLLKLVAAIALPLPASWAHGFPMLEDLLLRSDVDHPSAAAAAAAAGRSERSDHALPSSAARQGSLLHPPPPEWARGFRKLKTLTLLSLGLNGTFPAAWQAKGSFPQLRELELGSNFLSGRLPAHIVCNLPSLGQLKLGNNFFTGGLPAEWAACENDLSGFAVMRNQLTGLAFPPAWLAPNSTLDLPYYEITDNPGLVGSLPPSLNWSRLEILYVRGTGVDGRIPEQWCHARFARRIRQIDIDAVREPGFFEHAPPCITRDMPSFANWAREARAQANYGAGGARDAGDAALAGGGGGRLLLLLLALLAVGTAAAIAAWNGGCHRSAVGWRPAWLRQRLGSRDTTEAEEGEEEGIELLRRDDALHGSRMRHRRPHQLQGLAPGRARLKALVQQQLGGRALRSGRPETQLLSTLKGAAHSLAAAPANNHPPAASAPLSRSDHPASTAYGATVPLVRRWGLLTDSLRMAAADLQFIAEPDGALVQLGEGAHGVVYLGKLQDTYVAVKVFAVQQGVDSQVFWHEISLLQRCIHPRIVPVLGVAVNGELLMVAMQLMLGGSLRVALTDPERQDELRWSNRGRRVALDVAEAVAYLHNEARILHSDVKSANVLLSLDGRAALTDLGVGQVMESTARTAAGGSNLYAAPEQLLGERCTLAVDIYSLGLLLVELTTRARIIKRGQWELPRPPDDCPQDVADLIGQCLSSDPRQRPTAAEALRRLRASGGGGGGQLDAAGDRT